jgi:hypothetical protein
LRRTQVLLPSNMRRILRRRMKRAGRRVLADRNLQRHRKDRLSHLEEAGGRMGVADLRLDSVGAVLMAAAGDLRLDSVEAVAPMAAAVGRRPESAEADHRVVVAGGTAVMARAD